MNPLVNIAPSQERIIIDPNKKLDESDDYDPYKNRVVAKPTTDLETILHMLKGVVGTGVLALPEGFKSTGIWSGVAATFFCAAVICHSTHIVFKCEYILCRMLKIPFITYAQAMDLSIQVGPPKIRKFAPYFMNLVDMFLIMYQIGTTAVYVIFVAENIKDVVDYVCHVKIQLQIYMLFLLVPFLAINCIPNLKLLVPFSTAANITILLALGLVLYYATRAPQKLSSLPAFNSINGCALFIGTSLFAITSIAIFLALEENMKTPENFRKPFGVLNIATSIVTLLYVTVAFIGYWGYGDKIKSSITLNLPQNTPIGLAVKSLYAIAIFISFALQNYVPVMIIWNSYFYQYIEESDNKLAYNYLLRVVTVLIAYFLAISVPMLGLAISVVGAFCIAFLGLGFPAIMDICVRYSVGSFGPLKIMLIKDIFLILLGLWALGLGCYVPIRDIVNNLRTGNY